MLAGRAADLPCQQPPPLVGVNHNAGLGIFPTCKNDGKPVKSFGFSTVFSERQQTTHLVECDLSYFFEPIA
jgi:hypothetical protein